MVHANHYITIPILIGGCLSDTHKKIMGVVVTQCCCCCGETICSVKSCFFVSGIWLHLVLLMHTDSEQVLYIVFTNTF